MDEKDTKRLRLFTPGPVEPPPFVLEAMGRDLVHHRSPEFSAIYDGLTQKVQAVFETGGPVLVMTSSATGAMDAVVTSLFAAGDEVLVPVTGKFSRRWAEICQTYGVRARVLEFEPGRSPSPEEIRGAVGRHPDARGILITHCETSTGSLEDLEGISKAVADLEKEGRVILKCADCVSSFCVDEVRMDAWGLDCVITASQKGLLSPAGLSFVALGERACDALERVPPRNYYFDLRRYFAGIFRSSAPFTPALSLMYAVSAALDRIIEIGLEDVLIWGRRAVEALEIVLKSAGFETVADRQSSAVLAFWVGSVNAENLARGLEDDYGVYLARGQGHLRDKILRVSPIGKTRKELVDFSRALLTTAGNVEESRALDAERISEICDAVGDLLGGRDIWA